ncbi:hypothetical protein HYU16_04605 [Candidatus Woesearchaeota archaeon]|nr:hypothetical protein [Candidatus Woesearchaeota archaeon]
MGSSLVASMETRPIRGKPAMEHEGVGYEEDDMEATQEPQQQTGMELLMRRSYSIPKRPGVKVERTVWAYRER